ncbi:MAG: sigma-70 family RNA polymerase sigma factor [candidate division WOR-3 bacterium]|nr:sigma-70 family RNA polymerase sigma factor [candidate division WOR-3 bacterium]
MKNYNLKNYIRYKDDLKCSLPKNKPWSQYTRDELIISLLPFAEQIARSFSTSDRASGVMTINDIIQEASLGLCQAVDRIDWDKVTMDDDVPRQIRGFVMKRIRGAVRRAIDSNRGDMRIPEHKLNELRKDNGMDKELVKMFFNSVFLSIDEDPNSGDYLKQADPTKTYNREMVHLYVMSIMKLYLDPREYEILRLSFGLDCERLPAKEIAKHVGITSSASFVRVSQIKRGALNKLYLSVDEDSVNTYLAD